MIDYVYCQGNPINDCVVWRRGLSMFTPWSLSSRRSWIKNMSFLDGILFFFIVPWTPIVGGQRVNTRLSPVKNRPPDNDQIFDIQTPTDSQCIYNCIQNGKCLAVVYDKRRYLCNGYRSITANQSLTQEQQAWHIIYKG